MKSFVSAMFIPYKDGIQGQIHLGRFFCKRKNAIGTAWKRALTMGLSDGKITLYRISSRV